MKKRILSMFIAVVMMVTAVPFTAITVVANTSNVYLEIDITATQLSGFQRFPLNGSFVMNGQDYFRGIAHGTGVYDSNNSTATYNISGQGFTRLIGTFGRRSGSEGGTLTVTGDGQLLGGFSLVANSAPIPIDITIPANVNQVIIRLQGGGRLGFADAHFSSSTQSLAPIQPPTISGAAYLEIDITATQLSGFQRFPLNGSFVMNGQDYFRGIAHGTGVYDSNNSTATYNISGQGFTRLIGTFGRRSGSEGGTLTVTGDGQLLGGFSLVANSAPIPIDITIPANVNQVIIRLQGGGRLGFVDAYFINLAPTVTGVTVNPSDIEVQIGTTRQFTSTVQGLNDPSQAVTWSVSGNSHAETTINTSGLLTVHADEATASSLTVTATSAANTAFFGTATVEVVEHEPIVAVTSIEIIPNAIMLNRGSSYTFGAAVTGTNAPPTGVTWEISGNESVGTFINASGFLTIAANETAENLTVTARSTHTNTISGTATITVNKPTQTFTISFNLNGATGTAPTPRTTGTDGRLSSLPTPTRSGHDFDGWFTAQTGGSRVTVNTVFSANDTVFARWTATSGGNNPGGGGGGGSGDSDTTTQARTITFNLNGGSLSSSTANFTRTTQTSGILAVAQRPANPTRAGYTFNGWFTAATGGTQRDIASFAFTANTTLFAQWSAITISFNLNGGTSAINPLNPRTVNENGRVTLPPSPTRAGYTFAGWFTSATGGTEVTANTTFSANATIFAQWNIANSGLGESFTTADALVILRAVANLITLTSEQRARYDLDGNGIITTNDALVILRIVAGIIKVA